MKNFLTVITLLCAIVVSPGLAAAQNGVYTVVTSEHSFEDTATAVENGIINRGFKMDYHGYIGDMLKRTAEDVGAKKTLYSDAEFFTFCSAALSRKVMEAEITDIAYCPYVVFVYEDAGNPGQVTLGFRELPSGGERDTINTLLKEIVDTAAEGF